MPESIHELAERGRLALRVRHALNVVGDTGIIEYLDLIAGRTHEPCARAIVPCLGSHMTSRDVAQHVGHRLHIDFESQMLLAIKPGAANDDRRAARLWR